MAALQFTGDWEQDDGRWYMSGEFVYRSGDISMRLHLSEPNLFTTTDYADFIEGRRDTLVFCDSNGGVSIGREEDRVVFTVGKFGAGGGGELEVSAAQSACREAFADLIALRKLHRSEE